MFAHTTVVRGWLAKQLVKRLRKELKKKQEGKATVLF